jgi:hypothetical protein
LQIYSTENDKVRNASVIENATSRLKVGLCVQKASLKVLRESWLLFSLKFTLRFPDRTNGICLYGTEVTADGNEWIESCPSGVLTRFLSTLAELIRLRVFDLGWILWLVWENIAPGRLAGVVVCLLPLRLRDGHTQNFACTPKSVDKLLHTQRATYQMGHKHPLLHVHFFSEEGERGEASEMLLPSSSLRFLPSRGHVIPSFSLVLYFR